KRFQSRSFALAWASVSCTEPLWGRPAEGPTGRPGCASVSGLTRMRLRGAGDQIDAGVRADSGRIDDQVEDRCVARVGAVEVLDVQIAGAIGLPHPLLGGVEVHALDAHRLFEPGVLRAEQAMR